MTASKVIVGILLLAVTVHCLPTQRGKVRLDTRTLPPNNDTSTLKSGLPSFVNGSKIQSQHQETASHDPLSQLVSSFALLFKTLAEVLQSLTPSLRTLGPVLGRLLNSSSPQNATTDDATTPNPLESQTLGSVSGILLSSSSPQNATSDCATTSNPLETSVETVLANSTENVVVTDKQGETSRTDQLGQGSLINGVTLVAPTKASLGVGSVIDSGSSIFGPTFGMDSSSKGKVGSGFPHFGRPGSDNVPSRLGHLYGSGTSFKGNVKSAVPISSKVSAKNLLLHKLLTGSGQLQSVHRQMVSANDQGKAAAVGHFVGKSCESSCFYMYKYKPVCSFSGNTYNNACTLKCRGEKFQCYGVCPCPRG